MAADRFDILVVGAGPAGLGAARTAARLGFRTLVIDRLSSADDMAYPSASMVAPLPGFVSGQRADDGLRFPEIDLHIPPAMIAGYPTTQRLISPSGNEFSAPLSSGEDFPVAVIDKPSLLTMLSEQARKAGAEIRFGTSAIGLLRTGKRVIGVQTGDGVIEADLVVSAEGTSRQLCDEAGLYSGARAVRRYAFVVSQEFEAPAVGAEHLGQVVTLGHRYTSAHEAFGTVLMAAPGRATVHFTIFGEGPRYHTDRALWFYLDEYIHGDPRVSPYFVGARLLGGSCHRLVLREMPGQIVQDGFIGVGDATTPGGHLGIVPAIYLGRQAVFSAAEALDSSDVSAAQLDSYQRWVHGPILDSLDAEHRLILGLMRMTDEEVDHVCHTLHTLRVTAPFFGTWRTISWEAAGWFLKMFPQVSASWHLLERALSEPQVSWLMPATSKPASQVDSLGLEVR